jgi:hypothetical protein
MTTPDSSLGPDVLDALRKGRTIDAIKFLRTEKGIGLKEAKDIIDAHLRSASARADFREAKAAVKTVQPVATATPAGCSPGEVPRSRDFTWFIVALAVGAFFGYYYFFM